MDKTLDRGLLIGAGVLAVFLLVGGYLSVRNTRSLQNDSEWVTHTQAIMNASNELLRRIEETELAARGFVIAGDEHFLTPYTDAITVLDSLFDQLAELIRKNELQATRLQKWRDLNSIEQTLLKEVIELRRRDPDAAEAFIASRKTKIQLDAIRSLVSDFQTEERTLLAMREQQSDYAIQISVTSNLLIVGFGLLGIGAFLGMTRRMIRRLQTNAKELNERHERFSGLMQSLMDGVISIGTDQKILLFNPAAERGFGYSASQIIGQRIEMLMPRAFRQSHEEYVRKFGQTGVTNRKMGNLGEVSGLRASGEEFPIEASISQMDIDGQKVFTVILRDISERKKAETELRIAIENLATSNKELEQFAYVASHDLQEPLRAIAGCVQILQKRYHDKLDASAVELIGHTVEGASRMQTLINDLLAYSRVTTRSREPSRTDSAAALKLAIRNLEVAIHVSGATITNDELPTVEADTTQLAQVFQNLLGNAMKFVRVSPPTIHIGVRRDGENWLFSVADNGIGIAPEYYERIFGVFQRLHTRNEYPGTGIGLSICRKIVERHGGRMWVESKLGEGSTFFFTLPEKIDAP